jgi:hypothetical protein
MMAINDASAPPRYRGSAPASSSGPGLCGGVLGYLFGGGTPAYKGTAQSTVSRCWWQAFPRSPQYKTPPVIKPTDPPPDPLPFGCEDTDPGEALGYPAEPGSTQIHIWQG